MATLTRAEAIDAFATIHKELIASKDGDNHDAERFVAARQRVTALADRGALVIPAIPLAVNLAGMWSYVDRGMLPEDGGAPIHAFHRRLFFFIGAAQRILDTLSDDLVWKLHTVVPAGDAPGTPAARATAAAAQPDTKPITKPPRPALFIGSTVEALEVARAVHSELDYDLEVTIWNHGLFDAGAMTWTTLLERAPTFDFALFIFSGDDQVLTRGEASLGIRDNVLIEYGLFAGALGSPRTFFLYNRTSRPRIASDLAGVTGLTYQEREDHNLLAAVGPACDSIRRAAKKLGLR